MLELINEPASETATYVGCSCCDDGDGGCDSGFDNCANFDD